MLGVMSDHPSAPTPGLPPRERWFDDFHVGDSFAFGAYAITEREIVDFASRWDPQSFHLDHAAAAASHFGGLVASGWMTAGVMMRLLCEHFISPEASMGSPGLDELRWLQPVRPGDVLGVRVEVLEARPSRSKPDRGVLRLREEVLNQRGEVVMSVLAMAMMRRRK